MGYDWTSDMHPSPWKESEARGQAAASFLPDGRVWLACMPDRNCFTGEAVISADDARELALAILTRTGPNPPLERFPEGTPEYAAYRELLNRELDKFARGEAPYPYTSIR